jgi:osmotically-inducible protein OsmY
MAAGRLSGILLLAGTLAVSGCAAVSPERSFGRDLDDASASMAIKSAMLRASDHWLAGVDVEVDDGVALLAGTVPREQDRRLAECLAWQPSTVRMVANELQIARAPSTRDYMTNGWITQQVNARLLGDGSVRSTNINVNVHDGVVYLTGLARTPEERENAAAQASVVNGVERVVVYVRALGEDPDFEGRAEAREAACAEQSPELKAGAG